ncbi:MAG: phage holin family protein [Prevotella sp.]|nr:phage holin family protein [Prevotella sp.]
MSFSDSISAKEIILEGGVATTAVIFLQEAILNMIPFLFIAVILIIVDLYFGIKAAKKRGESIRPSRALRRTVGKAVEYVCWVILASTLSVAFNTQLIEWIVLGIVMGNELLSIITNYFEIHGYKIQGLNIFKIVGEKAGIDTSEVTVEKIPEKKAKKNADKAEK